MCVSRSTSLFMNAAVNWRADNVKNFALLENFRQRNTEKLLYGDSDDGGVFMLRSPIDGGLLVVIASNGEGWDHVSVSRSNRCPNWPEMEFIKRTFFKDDECAMQLHIPITAHINLHPHCLHLWRPHHDKIPRPPGWMVAPVKKSA